MIRVACEACGAAFQAKDEHAGRRGKCPRCGEPIVVPEPDLIDEGEDEDEDEFEEEQQDDEAPVAPVRRGRSRRPARRGRGGGSSGRHALAAGARLSGARRRRSGGNPVVVILVVVVVLAGLGWGTLHFMGKLGVEGHFGVARDHASAGRYDEAIALLEKIGVDDPMYTLAQDEIARLRETRDAGARSKAHNEATDLHVWVMAFRKNQVDNVDPDTPEYAATVRFMLIRAQEYLDAHPDAAGAGEISALMTEFVGVASPSAPPTEWDANVEVKWRVYSKQFDLAWNAVAALANQPGDHDEYVGTLYGDIQNAAREEWAAVLSELESNALREGAENWNMVRSRTRRYLDSVKGVPGVDTEARTWHDRAVRALGG